MHLSFLSAQWYCMVGHQQGGAGATSAPNPYEASLGQETNESLERFFAMFSAFRVLA
jgi:hypothetical protein